MTFAVILGATILIYILACFVVGVAKGKRIERNNKILRSMDIDSMSGYDFEYFVASLLEEIGYKNVKVTPGSGDFGIDIVASKRDVRYAIQVKRMSSKVSRRAVSDVVAGMRFRNCNGSMVVTNNYFTESTKNFAKKLNCQLIDREELGKWLKIAGAENATPAAFASRPGTPARKGFHHFQDESQIREVKFKVVRMHASGLSESPKFDCPTGICIYENGVLVCDSGLGKVYKIFSSGYKELNLNPLFDDGAIGGVPTDVEVTCDGRILVAMSRFSGWVEVPPKIIKVLDSNGCVLGSFGELHFSEPGNVGPVGTLYYSNGLASDSSGLIYVADMGNHRIQVFRFDGPKNEEMARAINWWGGLSPKWNGKPKVGEWYTPSALVVRMNRVYISDIMNPRVHCFDLDGSPLGIWDLSTGPFDENPEISSLAFLPCGKLLCLEKARNSISLISPQGRLIGRFGRGGMGPGEFCSPEGMCIDKHGTVYVADTGNKRIQVLKLEE